MLSGDWFIDDHFLKTAMQQPSIAAWPLKAHVPAEGISCLKLDPSAR